MACIVPTILAGGAGERLWPLSQADSPKQFALKNKQGYSLFQATVLRVADRARFAAPLVLCNRQHRFLAREQLRAIACDDAVILVEPELRNTASAIALAAMHVMEEQPDAVMLVLPSDHAIARVEALAAAVEASLPAAEAGHIVTFGITPESAETGYGYIHYGEEISGYEGLRTMERFIEKPDFELAARLIREGNYGWNSGMFLMAAGALLDEYRTHAPAIHHACERAYAKHTIEHECLCPEATAFRESPAIAFDYAIMEHTTRGAVMPVEMGWRDLGSWMALDGAAHKDAAGNAVSGAASLREVEDCFVHADTLHVAAVGLRDLLVVESNGHVLVAPKERALEVKVFVAAQRAQTMASLYHVTHRPWGNFSVIERGMDYQVKKLMIVPGGKISLQTHRARSEHWVVVQGTATVTRDDAVLTLHANQSAYIAAGQRHRLENRGAEALVVIEVQTGAYLGEDDIERFEDAYARADA